MPVYLWDQYVSSKTAFVCALTRVYARQDGMPKPLLPPIEPKYAGRKCLVLDLDETLVHSSLKVSPPRKVERHNH